MASAFAAVVALLPKVFFLYTHEMSGLNWLALGVIVACGLAVLFLLTRLLRSRLNRLEGRLQQNP